MPLSWWPTTTTPAFQLVSMFWEAVGICEKENVHVHAVVADGASINRKFFELISRQQPEHNSIYAAPNPYNDKPILLCSDTSHLLKVCNKCQKQ